jgi:hypothetical protein
MVEDVCDERDIALVIHSTIRKALTGFDGAFSIPMATFLGGGRKAAYLLPLPGGGDVKLVFSLLRTLSRHIILRVDPARPDGLPRSK